MGKQQRRDKIARLISWGHWFTFANILVCLAIGTLYIEAAESPGTVIGVIYLLVSWIGHFAFLPFVFFIILIFPFCLLVPYTRVLRGISALIASLGLIALMADALFFRYYGYHLNTYSLSQLAADAEATFAGASFVIMLGILITFVVILVIEMVLANLAWKRLDIIHSRRVGAPFTTVFVLCFLISHSVHIWADGVFYGPITQQDDLFPLSYPTTAKTLMSKHGLIDGSNYDARQEIISAADNIKLNYPTSPIMCAKAANPPSTLVVVFDQLSEAQQTEFLAAVPSLKAAPVTLLGHRELDRGVFQFSYSLADIYQPAIQNARQLPAYLPSLADFSIQPAWQRTASFPANVIPTTLRGVIANADDEPTLIADNTNTGLQIIFAGNADYAKMAVLIQQAEATNVRVMVTSFTSTTNAPADMALSPNQLAVPLWISGNWNIQQQPLANLSDLMPTLLADLIACNNGLSSVSQGRNLSDVNDSYPQVLSFAPYIVIYDDELTTVLDRNGTMQVFSTASFTLLEGAEPPTPVLVDAIEELKRFSESNKEKAARR